MALAINRVHGRLLKSGHLFRISTFNFLLNLYSKNLLQSALNLFDETPQRNIISWNTIISGFAVKEYPCLFLLKEMMLENIKPDHITFMGILRSRQGVLINGEQAHSLAFRLGFSHLASVSTAMVNMYGKLGRPTSARRLFDEMSFPDQISFNAMISCYTLNALSNKAFLVFNLMRSKALIQGDPYTFSSLLTACSLSGSFNLGEQVHALVSKSCPLTDSILLCSIINFYSRHGFMDSMVKCFFASEFFSVTRCAAPWNSFIASCPYPVHHLREMLRQRVEPDDVTFSSILSSCARSAMAGEILQLHAHVIMRGLEGFMSIMNVMIISYARCGTIHDAFVAFSLISSPDLITWTSMISTCATHGLGLEALKILNKMVQTGMELDHIAFLQILTACAHCGLVEEGLGCFVNIMEVHNFEPSPEHYTCLLDLLGRAGCLLEAGHLLSNILQVSGSDGSSYFGAFLSACRIHGNSRLAELAVGFILKSGMDRPVDFLDMSGVYASCGSWVSAERARKIMGLRGRKLSGCSWAG